MSEPVITTALVGWAFVVIFCIVVTVCVTVFNVMTDNGRLELLKRTRELETQKEIERLKTFGDLKEKP